MRRCSHSVYWPENQKVAHGCSFCNPQEADLTPEKTFAVFRIMNRSELEKIGLHSYGTKVQYKGARAVEMLARYPVEGISLYGGSTTVTYWHSAVPHV